MLKLKKINYKKQVLNCEFKVGDFVYKHYKPQNPGKILNIRTSGDYTQYDIEIKWLKDKKITVEPDYGIADFSLLIEDYKRKLSTNISKLRDLAKL